MAVGVEEGDDVGVMRGVTSLTGIGNTGRFVGASAAMQAATSPGIRDRFSNNDFNMGLFI